MELSTIDKQSDVLLTGKNALNESVVDKYRLAGQITQTCLKYVISLIHGSYHLHTITPPLSPSEICVLGDSYLSNALANVYGKTVVEKGIAHPVSLDINDFANGISPEVNGNQKKIDQPFTPGDIVKITLGSHVDGYTAIVSHTVVIYPPNQNSDNPQPEGPLLGNKADAICAAFIATEAVISLLGCSMYLEKLPGKYQGASKVTGTMIREVVDTVAKEFGCTVVPGSKVRRVRRFLAGQAENIVAEKDFKGVIWSEAHQEYDLLQKSKANNNELIKLSDAKAQEKFNKLGISESSAIPTDEFIIQPGEAYNIDIKMASVTQFSQPGFITLQNIDEFSGKNNNVEAISLKSDVFIRDFAMQHGLKLKSSKKLLNKAEKISSVYPFKISHFVNDGKEFPIKIYNTSIENQRKQIKELGNKLNSYKLGANECINNHLIVEKKIQTGRFLSLETILNNHNPNARSGSNNNDLTLMYNSLPGFEVPLPKLGITHLKLTSLLKNSEPVDIARESSTIILNNYQSQINKQNEVLRLTGSTKFFPANWVHSNFKLLDDDVLALIKVGQDGRFGVKVKECQPMKLTGYEIKHDGEVQTKMALD